MNTVSKEIAAQDQAHSPPVAQTAGFGRGLTTSMHAGAVTIEVERAVAEAQGKLYLAKRFPRDVGAAQQELLMACQEPSLAKVAFYAYPRGNETVSGPSIRLAEEIARCWGNFEYGIRELSTTGGMSEMEAFAWDLQTNTYNAQKFGVKHVRDTKNGPKPVTDQRDIYELGANMGGRRLRARILALAPKWLVAMAVEQCKATLASADKGIPMTDRIRKMQAAFLKYGVKVDHIEAKLGKKLDSVTDEDLVELRGVLNALRDNAGSADDFFDMAASTIATAAAITAQAQATAAAKPASLDSGNAEQLPKETAKQERKAAQPKPPPEPTPTADPQQQGVKPAETPTAQLNLAEPAAQQQVPETTDDEPF